MHNHSTATLTGAALLLAILAATAPAAPAAYEASPAVQATFRSIAAQSPVRQGLAFLQNDHTATLADQKAIVAIPAPPFQEKARAEYYLKRLIDLGLAGASMDGEGNVCAARPGRGGGPLVLLEAHLDTVFPAGTNVVPVERDGRLYAPGIADNARGLAALLAVARALNTAGIRTVGDILFCGTVGEEGLGDLRGMKALFKARPQIAASVSIDGTGPDHVVYLATGSRRYEVTYRGPGGHSFAAFGTPSAIHAMGRAIARIGDLQTPKSPRTTYTVGTVSGGTSVNSIAADATMLVDMRSNSGDELARLESRLLPLVRQAAAEENARWRSEKIQVALKLVGDRPAGSQPAESPIVQAAWEATRLIGRRPLLADGSSTNANLPISLGVPAITIGGGGREGENHSPGEWFDPTGAHLGPQKIFAAILGLAGVEGVTQPLLPPRVPRRE